MHEIRNVQTPYTEADFWEKWSSVNPRMTVCLKITPSPFWADVSPVGITSNSRNMTLPGHSGVTFYAKPGLTPSVVEQALGESTLLEMQGLYQAGIFEREDVLSGKWNFARYEIFSVCWDNVNLGELVHATGTMGEIIDYEFYFKAEGRGLIDRLGRDVNTVTERSCRVKEFRDAQCGHTASTVTIDGTAYNIEQTGGPGSPGAAFNVLVFDTSLWAGNNPPPCVAENDLFANGKITCTSGANNGISREISAVREATGGFPYIFVNLKRAFPYEITGEETFNFVAGCARRIEDCRKYQNAVNFRGEPYLPNIEAANRVASGN